MTLPDDAILVYAQDDKLVAVQRYNGEFRSTNGEGWTHFEDLDKHIRSVSSWSVILEHANLLQTLVVWKNHDDDDGPPPDITEEAMMRRYITLLDIAELETSLHGDAVERIEGGAQELRILLRLALGLLKNTTPTALRRTLRKANAQQLREKVRDGV